MDQAYAAERHLRHGLNRDTSIGREPEDVSKVVLGAW
jgi:hypothetical protein